MALTDLKVFNTSVEEKARIKRGSSGEFSIVGGCLLSRSVAERYVDYVLFNKATSGGFSIQCVQVK
jgi:hypothetical protein